MECLIALSELSQQSDITSEIFLQNCVKLIPPAFQYPQWTCAKIFYENQVYLTENFVTTPWVLKSDIIINSCCPCVIEVYLIKELNFLKEEKVLINTMAKFLSRILESQEAKKALKNSLNNYQEIFNSTHEAFFIHDTITGKIIDVNNSMLEMYGYSNKEEVLGLSISDFSLNQQETINYIDQVFKEGSCVCEWLAKKATGEIFWVEVSLKLTEISSKCRILMVVRDIHERKQQEQKIKYLTRLYATLSQINQSIITHKKPESLFQSICEVASKIGQFPLVWIGIIDVNTHQIVPFTFAGKTTEYLRNIYITELDEPSGRGPCGVAAREARLVISEDILHDPKMTPWRSQALKYGYKSSAALPIKEGGKVIGVLTLYSEDAGFFTKQEQGLLQEIGDNIAFALDAIQSQQKHDQIQLLLQENEERLRLALKAANQGLYDLNIQTGKASVSPEYALMLGYEPTEFEETNAKWIERLHPDDRDSVSNAYRLYINGEMPYYRIEFRQQTATGDWKWILSVGKIVEWNNNGQPLRMLGTHTDITKYKQAELQIEQLAYYDPLTTLPNRRLLFDRIIKSLALAKQTGDYGAILFIDLDQFKTLNDARGHDFGDFLLQKVALRLKQSISETEIVGRFGGDEFIVLLPQLSKNQDIAINLSTTIAEKIRDELSTSFLIEEEELTISVSIGITIFPKDNETLKDLLKEADTAMYKGKARGRNMICLFEPQMQIEAEYRFILEKEMRHALEEHQFLIFLQPQVNHKKEIIGAEALIRWQHPLRGLISPIEFIPLAEETGLIIKIGEWVLQEVCYYLREIQKTDSYLRLSVNISPCQFRQSHFVENVKSIIKKTEVNPNYLTLEVTEGLIIEDITQAIETINQLKSLGIQFSIDDFGTGYSSLSYLKRLPINELKIDKSFVQDALYNISDAGLIEAIIAVAQYFNLKIVAEGVETVEQAEFLRVRGCNYYQGYLYGKPVPMSEFKLS
ncbi:diguanylate cyclase/phosphodiesterase with PAS/PAC sensor [Geminocystis sp. NIES-3708]|uniref:bifunctional diguanylate cyclase/phosphodiesterase n=1 Tax=Geminocystis sp. NIES-3708 TaxID=1615909 RepID=UPI0005FCA043|nr:EAL domain-containing protein [Geminocystis sp. NIES-3708]BAQ61969.1 diguanylate cyclase/phosphodiesterase with PAS/PAC sensor [Geminocystis sp. NIES-3708]